MIKQEMKDKVFKAVIPEKDRCGTCIFHTIDFNSGYEVCTANDYMCIYDSVRWKNNHNIPEWCPFEFYRLFE